MDSAGEVHPEGVLDVVEGAVASPLVAVHSVDHPRVEASPEALVEVEEAVTERSCNLKYTINHTLHSTFLKEEHLHDTLCTMNTHLR